MAFAAQIVPIERRRVGQKKLIAGRIEYQFGHVQTMAVVVGIHQSVQFRQARIVEAPHDVVRHVVANRRRPEAVRGEVVAHGGRHVQHVDDDRQDADHAIIHRAGQPSRPTTLGTTGYDEAIDVALATGCRGHHRRHRIHRPHGALHHCVARQPARIADLQEMRPRIANQVVFIARHAVVVEYQRLIGNHAELGHDRAGGLGNGGHALVGRGGRVAAVAAAADVQERHVGDQWRRNGERQPVLPSGPIHFLGRQPSLRDHVHHNGLQAIDLLDGDDLPRIAVVHRLDVVVDSGSPRQFAGKDANAGSKSKEQREPSEG